jgi:cytidylate kinase
MYRAITYMAIKEGINLDYEESYAFIKDITIEYTNDKIYASGEDVTEKIRSDIVTKNVSKVSSFPSVRTYLVEIQKASAKGKNVIMDGRDIGTVVLPNADLKIFLTANIEERAKRRMRELQLKGRDIDLTTMIKDIEERDKKDSERKASPLIIPKDAIIVDTTHYTIEDTVNRIKHEILKKETYHGRD